MTKRINEEECPFHPKINEKCKASKSKFAKMNFQDRQKEFQEIKNKKLNELKEKEMLKTVIDEKTEQKLYKPVINENIEIERKEPIYIELYNLDEKYRLKKENLKKSVKAKRNNNFKVSGASEAMKERRKVNSFHKIFNILDSDDDGKITKDDIKNSNLPDRLIKVMNPIIKEIEEKENNVELDEFMSKCEDLYKKLNYADKNEIYTYSIVGQNKGIYENDGKEYQMYRTSTKGSNKYKRDFQYQNDTAAKYYYIDAYRQTKYFQKLDNTL